MFIGVGIAQIIGFKIVERRAPVFRILDIIEGRGIPAVMIVFANIAVKVLDFNRVIAIVNGDDFKFQIVFYILVPTADDGVCYWWS